MRPIESFFIGWISVLCLIFVYQARDIKITMQNTLSYQARTDGRELALQYFTAESEKQKIMLGTVFQYYAAVYAMRDSLPKAHVKSLKKDFCHFISNPDHYVYWLSLDTNLWDEFKDFVDECREKND